MNRSPLIPSLLLACTLLPLSAQPAPAPAGGAAPPALSGPKLLIFHQPSDVSGETVAVRVGGGSRGTLASDLVLEALAPTQIALTTKAQPSLYWYQNEAATTECQITVTEPNNPKPLLSLKTGKTTPAGIHAVRLAKFDKTLKTGVTYRWSVAVVLDPHARSLDVVASGVVKRIDPSPDLAARLATTSGADQPALYAETGIWYDALQSISDQIDHAPDDAALRAQRTSLLGQIGISDGAKMEKPATK